MTENNEHLKYGTVHSTAYKAVTVRFT